MQDQVLAHQNFVEKFSIVGGGVIALLGGCLIWMNYTTKSNVETEVRKQLETIVSQKIASFTPKIEQMITESISDLDLKIAGLTKDFEARALESTQRIDEIIAMIESRARFVNKTLFEQASPKDNDDMREAANPEPPDTHPDTAASRAGVTDSRAVSADSYDEAISGLKILWVDDFPRNNEELASALRSLGAQVETALSTDEAMTKITSDSAFNLVISDMGRGKEYNAGVNLVNRLRTAGLSIPVIIYCSPRGVQQYGDAAKRAGAWDVVSGPSRLFAAIKSLVMSNQRS